MKLIEAYNIGYNGLDLESDDPELMEAHEAGWNDWVDWLTENNGGSAFGPYGDPSRYAGSLTKKWISGKSQGIDTNLVKAKDKVDEMMDTVYKAATARYPAVLFHKYSGIDFKQHSGSDKYSMRISRG